MQNRQAKPEAEKDWSPLPIPALIQRRLVSLRIASQRRLSNILTFYPHADHIQEPSCLSIPCGISNPIIAVDPCRAHGLRRSSLILHPHHPSGVAVVYIDLYSCSPPSLCQTIRLPLGHLISQPSLADILAAGRFTIVPSVFENDRFSAQSWIESISHTGNPAKLS